jgi:hypothetical protein
MYYEIPFIRSEADRSCGESSADHLKQRFAEMSTIVDKLDKAGLSVHLTLTGVAFSLKCSVFTQTNLFKYGDLPTEKAEQIFIRKKFTELGIDEEFRTCASRSVLELLKADVEQDDRVRYDEIEENLRHGDLYPESYEKEELLREMAEMERLYGRRNLLIANSYERGTVHGHLQALRWMLGMEWEEFLFSDNCMEGFDAECDRDELVRERAEDKLEQLLSPNTHKSADSEDDDALNSDSHTHGSLSGYDEDAETD